MTYLAVTTDDMNDPTRDVWCVDGPDGSICTIDTPAQDAQAMAERIARALNADTKCIALVRRLATLPPKFGSEWQSAQNEARDIIEELDA
jgi:hypothetical protein